MTYGSPKAGEVGRKGRKRKRAGKEGEKREEKKETRSFVPLVIFFSKVGAYAEDIRLKLITYDTLMFCMQVYNTPQSAAFLNVLQSLLRVTRDNTNW